MFPNIIKKRFDISNIEADIKEKSEKKLHEKQKALERSIKEGAFTNFSRGLISTYITPFALLLNSTPFQIGILSSLSGLASPFGQMFGSNLLEKHPRKKIVVTFTILQILMLIPIISLAYLFSEGLLLSELPYILIALYTTYFVFIGTTIPAWFSWMGDLVPEKDRGRYFSIRNRITAIAGGVAVILAAFFLDYFKTKGLALLGFSIVYSIAFIAGIIGTLYFKKQYSPKFKLNKKKSLSFGKFIKTPGNYRTFTFYQFFFHLSLMFASPFIAVYMLEELNYSYVTFTLVALSAAIFYIIFLPLLGSFSDKFGPAKLLKLSNSLFVVTLIPWIFFKNPIAIIFSAQIVSGIANASYTVGITNFRFESLSKDRIASGVAYTNLFIGFGAFFGSLIGGFVLKTYSTLSLFSFFDIFMIIFVISALLRLVTGLIFLPKIKDIKKFKAVPSLHLSIFHPFKSIHSEISWLRTVSR